MRLRMTRVAAATDGQPTTLVTGSRVWPTIRTGMSPPSAAPSAATRPADRSAAGASSQPNGGSSALAAPAE